MLILLRKALFDSNGNLIGEAPILIPRDRIKEIRESSTISGQSDVFYIDVYGDFISIVTVLDTVYEIYEQQ